MQAESVSLRAMGTDVQVTVVGGSRLLIDHAVRRIEDLEARWSRFLPNSEVSRMNRVAGRATIVSPDTLRLLLRSIEAVDLSRGSFDPTMLTEIRAAGYDRSFELLPPPAPGPQDAAAHAPMRRRASMASEVEVDPGLRAVKLPAGSGFDPGGIGKGMAADIVNEELIELGAEGVCVNVGGDLRLWGLPPEGSMWLVKVADPVSGGAAAMLAIDAGGVATSSTTGRRWQQGMRQRHHLLDPRTGEPVISPLCSVTVVAGEAWKAEVLAKAALIAGPGGLKLLEEAGAVGLTVDHHGALELSTELKEVA